LQLELLITAIQMGCTDWALIAVVRVETAAAAADAADDVTASVAESCYRSDVTDGCRPVDLCSPALQSDTAAALS